MKARIFGGLFLMFAAATFAATAPSIVPRPVTVQTRAGNFTLCPNQLIPGAPAQAVTRILADPASQEAAQYLAATLFKSTGYRFPVETNSGSGVAVRRAIVLISSGAITNEGYDIVVAPDSVVIQGNKFNSLGTNTSAGIFYGVQTFLQLLPPQIFAQQPVHGVPWVIPCVHIQDFPRFKYRGWMLDSVRHFFNKDEIERLIDAMAVQKLNFLHWHLTDDSGWRLQIMQYPRLTEIGAWRQDIMWALNPRSSTAWDENERYGGFYTQDDVREIVAYAAQRQITIVPEIEMPGHATAALVSYPEYSCNGAYTNKDCINCLNVPPSFGLNNTAYSGGCFCIARPESFTFLTNVLKEVANLFPGPFMHVGGDEVVFTNWRNHQLDQDMMTNTLGFKDVTNQFGQVVVSQYQQYQAWFEQKMAKAVHDNFKKIMFGWSEILNGVTNGSTTVTNTVFGMTDWLGQAVHAATNNMPVVISSSGTLYLNRWETGDGSGGGVIWSNEPPSAGGIITLSTIYNYEPIPSQLQFNTDTNILLSVTNIIGLEGLAWAENIPSLLNLEFKLYPRLCAVAETGWTASSLKSFSDFGNRLPTHLQRLAQMGVNYNAETTPPQIATWTSAQISTNFTTVNWDITPAITNAGEIDLSFAWKTGTNGLSIAWAALVENGVELDRDTHDGFTFSNPAPSKPTYVLRLRSLRPGAAYTLRASVAGKGGTNSGGIVYMPNWD